MKQKFESDVMEKLKKGYLPVYEGEEGFIAISIKAYLAAAEYADAVRSRFWYGDLFFDLIDVIVRSEEIEAEDYDFMPAEIEREDADSMAPETESEARADEIFPDLEDVNDRYMLIAAGIRALAVDLYELHCDMLLRPEEIENKIQDIVAEMARYEKIFLRNTEYIRKKSEVKKE